MRILQITPAYKPAYIYGGPTVSVALLCEQLARDGNSISVLTTTANGKSELEIQPGLPQKVDGVTVTYFKRITKDHTHFSPALLYHVWKNVKRYDIVHIHGWWNTVSMLTAVIAKLRGTPYVISPRGMLSPYTFGNKNSGKKSILHRLLGKSLLQKSYIHTTSKNESLAVGRLTFARGLFEISNFISLNNPVTATEHANRKELRMIFFSRIEEKKGLDLLIEALGNVRVPYSLTIAGDGEPAYIERLKTQSKKNGSMQWLDWIGFRTVDKFSYLAGFDLMVLPSYDENFGNVVVESLSVGTAVLISQQVGLSDYVDVNGLGWVCDTETGSIANMINKAGEDIEKLERIRHIAPGKIRQDFSSHALLQKYNSMYSTILQGATFDGH